MMPKNASAYLVIIGDWIFIVINAARSAKIVIKIKIIV
jgi:hypothetical protein